MFILMLPHLKARPFLVDESEQQNARQAVPGRRNLGLTTLRKQTPGGEIAVDGVFEVFTPYSAFSALRGCGRTQES